MLIKGRRTLLTRDMGNGFVTHINMPGWITPRVEDHGYGPLAMIVESLMTPGRVIALHEHRNDEVISWVPDGVMRYNDKSGRELVIDSHRLIVMNAGTSFWHSDETRATDPDLRMLQIFVRPRAIDLEPGIQYGPIAAAPANTWRHLVGPEGTDAPFHVRNAVDFFDARLDAGARVEFPQAEGRDLYFYVFSGEVAAGGERFGEGEQALLVGDGALAAEAREPTVMVAFLIDPNATVTRQGTIGDHRKIPAPRVIGALKRLEWLGRLLGWGRRSTGRAR